MGMSGVWNLTFTMWLAMQNEKFLHSLWGYRGPTRAKGRFPGIHLGLNPYLLNIHRLTRDELTMMK